MVNAWLAATMVAIVAGAVGFFAVLRNSAFAAHALPQGAFAGAAGASLLGVSTLLGLGVFAGLGALVIGLFGRRGRNDVVIALTFVTLLALGSLFLSMSHEYAPEVFALLFGEIVGVSSADLVPIAVLGAASLAVLALAARPLVLSSVMPDVGEARGVRTGAMDLCFLGVLALATTMTVPVVGALLMFSLMIAPAAAARSLTARPGLAVAMSVVLALASAWGAIAVSYWTNWPVAFFVGAFGIAEYGGCRLLAARRARSRRGIAVPAPQVAAA
jgi:zinc/manganese transport system permease protein